MEQLLSEVNSWHKITWVNFGLENQYKNALAFPWIDKKAFYNGKGLEQICLLMSQNEDHVYMNGSVPDFVLEGYRSAGFALPHMHNLCDDDRTVAYSTDLLDGKFRDQIALLENYILMPFGITHKESSFAAETNQPSFGLDAANSEKLNSKIGLRQFALQHNIPCPFGLIAYNYNDAENFINQYIQRFQIVVKLNYGSSGTGVFVIRHFKEWKFLRRQLAKLKENTPLLIEKLYPVSDSFNYQLLAVNNKVELISFKHQNINNSLCYTGCDWEKNQIAIVEPTFHAAVETMKDLLLAHCKSGLINIDGIIDTDNRIFPAIDLNARFSLTSYFTLSHKLQASFYTYFRFRYYAYRSESREALIKIAKTYTFEKSEHAVFICCCYESSEISSGRVGILYCATDKISLNHLEKQTLAVLE